MESDIWPLLVIAFYIYLFASIIFLLLDNRKVSSTFAWLLAFIIFPVIGILVYIFLGKNHRIIGRRSRKPYQLIGEYIPNNQKQYIKDQKKLEDEVNEMCKSCNGRKIAKLLRHNSFSLLTKNNTVKILQNGIEKFPALVKDIKEAKHSIHMTYFIWRDDSMTRKIKDLLIQKVKEGVKVRILVDTLGASKISRKYKKEIREGGVQFYTYFSYLSPFSIHTISYRNHRKLSVIDGKIGYTGGMNMGKEYVDGADEYESWRDTHLRFEGEAVAILQSIFALEWEGAIKEKISNKKEYFPKVNKEIGETITQLTTSGPDSSWAAIQQMFFRMITSAKKKIILQSPYFIPEEDLMEALKTAALSGVDVRVMITGVPDKKIVYWAAFTYFEDLLKAGVRIFHYNKGFLHAKAIAIDSSICSIGTANFDVRSFIIDYELMATFYDSKVVLELEKDFENDLKDCEEMTLEKYNSIGKLAKLRNSAIRLISPIL